VSHDGRVHGGFTRRSHACALIEGMPLAFPSHQGLVLPLWRRWPRAIDGVALSVGAAVNDLVEVVAWPMRGELGQGAGHSVVGVVLFCVPLGLVIACVIRRWRIVAWLDPHPFRWKRAAWSVAIGALSHVVFDFFTHANFVVLWPWLVDADVFPRWWTTTWASIPLFVYRKPYPIAPHTIVWAIASIAGAIMFFGIGRSRSRARG
jgi:hypothetical protein